jgi:hypothetical protein
MAYSEAGYESDVRSTESGNASASENAETTSTSTDHDLAKQSETETTHAPDTGDRSTTSRDDSRSRPISWSDTDTDDRYRQTQPYSDAGAFWGVRRFFRRLFGWPDEPQPARMGAGNPAAIHLATLAREGHDLHPSYGNQSVAHVAEGLGVTALSGKMAYEQVAHMRENWATLDARSAQDRANAGGLVVAGSNGPVQAQTAIVVPGAGATAPNGAFFPNVMCGGLGNARSDGSRTVADVWPSSTRDSVAYFVPR